MSSTKRLLATRIRRFVVLSFGAAGIAVTIVACPLGGPAQPGNTTPPSQQPIWETYGTSGNGSGQFNGPCAIALDPSGRIYISDISDSRIVRIDDMNGKNWTAYGSYGTNPTVAGTLNGPKGIAFDSFGRIYVTDQYNACIVCMDDMTGKNWRSYGPTGQFYTPAGVAIDSLQSIYMADYNKNFIARMDDLNGRNLVTNTYTYGTLGTSPMAIAFDSSARIYWTDFANSLVFRMEDITGKNLTSAGGGQLFGPCGIALDSSGRIYIADEMNNRVVRMNDITGTGFTSYGSLGGGAGQFNLPQGIAVDSKGYVYVADYNNNRIVCFTFPQ